MRRLRGWWAMGEGDEVRRELKGVGRTRVPKRERLGKEVELQMRIEEEYCVELLQMD